MALMTFHESYGNLPTKTLKLVKKYNVSPSDFDDILDNIIATSVGQAWNMVNETILNNSVNGYYQPRFY